MIKRESSSPMIAELKPLISGVTQTTTQQPSSAFQRHPKSATHFDQSPHPSYSNLQPTSAQKMADQLLDLEQFVHQPQQPQQPAPIITPYQAYDQFIWLLYQPAVNQWLERLRYFAIWLRDHYLPSAIISRFFDNVAHVAYAASGAGFGGTFEVGLPFAKRQEMVRTAIIRLTGSVNNEQPQLPHLDSLIGYLNQRWSHDIDGSLSTALCQRIVLIFVDTHLQITKKMDSSIRKLKRQNL